MYVKYCPDNRFANSPKQIKFPALNEQILSPILDTPIIFMWASRNRELRLKQMKNYAYTLARINPHILFLDTDNSLSQQNFITLCLNEALFYLLYLFRLLYAIKTWENIKKSTFFQEYGRLLPWTVDENQPYLISWLQKLVWRKKAVSSVSRNRCSLETGALQYWWLEKSFQHHECSKYSPWGRTSCHYQEIG